MSASGTAGTFDTAWGGTGIVVTPTAAGHVYAVAAQADGMVLATGYETTGAVNGSGQPLTRWVVRRYTGAGVLDGGYGTGGVARLFGSYSVDQALDCAVDGTGRAVVVGKIGVATNGNGGYATVVAVVRLTAAGVLDTTFGTGGVVQANVSGYTLLNARVALQADGRIVVGAAASKPGKKGSVPILAALRYLDTGAADASFGTGGFAAQGFNWAASGFAAAFSYSGRTLGIQSNGGIVIGGRITDSHSNAIWTLVRFLPNGTADTSFANVTGPAGDALFSLRIDATDRIVAVGDRGAGAPETDTLVKRYLPGGALDTSFAAGGQYLSGLAGTDYAGDVAIQGDGSIVLALTRETATAGQYDFAPLRLTGNGAVDVSYGTGGIGAATGMPSSGTWGWSVAILPNGDAVIGGRVPGSPTAWAITACLPN